ncbi:MAG: hypothetical protein IKX86_02180 [Clostridia bacterium]|nr:hypothetical protein [Clostridia bacterium]
MKKIFALLVALVMVIAVFASCQKPGTNPGNDTTAKSEGNDTTAKAPETEPKGGDDTTAKTEDTSAAPEGGLPKKRTIYSTDTRDKLTLLDHGVDGVVVNDLNQGKGFAVDAVIDSDGKIEATIADWDVVNAGAGGHMTYEEGSNGATFKYFPFVGYTQELTINEIVIGDVSHWGHDSDGQGGWVGLDIFDDYDRLEVWYTDNPNGTWTKWNCTCTSFANPDNGILWGTYAQGLSFRGEDVTARYFIIYDPDPQLGELNLIQNVAGMAAIYNPAA